MGQREEPPRCPVGGKPGRGCSAPPRPHGVICGVTLSPCRRQGPWLFPVPFLGQAEQGTALVLTTAASSPGQLKAPVLSERLQLWGHLLPVLHSQKAEIWQRRQPAAASMQGRVVRSEETWEGRAGEPPAHPPRLLCPPLGPACQQRGHVCSRLGRGSGSVPAGITGSILALCSAPALIAVTAPGDPSLTAAPGCSRVIAQPDPDSPFDAHLRHFIKVIMG